MFLLFGTTERERLRGIVVDRCLTCRCLRRLDVVDTFSVWHAYFVPLGRGRFVGSTVYCRTCGARVAVGSPGFSRVLPADSAESLDEALTLTNPELAARLAAIRELAKLDDGTAYRSSESAGPSLARAVSWLQQLELLGEDSSELVAGFSDWQRLGPVARELVLARLEGYANAKGIDTA